MRVLSLALLAVIGSFAVACAPPSGPLGDDFIDPEAGTGETGGPGDDTGWNIGDETGLTSVELNLAPPNAVVYIDTGKTPLTGGVQAYTAKLADGSDATAGASFSLDDPSLGSFSGNIFTSATDLGKDTAGNPILGKTTIVTGTASTGQKGQAKITVVKLRKTEDPTTSARDFFFTVPYKADPDPKEDILKFTTNIQQVDVAFVMDSTGSMGGSITNLRSNLSSAIIPGLKAAIPSVGISVVDHKDYPVSPFGSGGDFPVKILAPIVVQATPADLTTVQNAVARYVASGGYDIPESQIPAMYHVLTGAGLSWPGGSLAAAKPASGTGGVGFRSGAVPVVVMISDANYHNGVGAAYSFTAPNLAQVKTAFGTANAKFVAVNVGTAPAADANNISDSTASNLPPSAFDGPSKPAGCGAGQCCTGLSGAGKAPDAPGGRCRLNFTVASTGTGVSGSIVSAIQALASGSVYDILPELSNDPTNAGGVDATKFIDRLEAFADATIGCAGTPRKSTSTMAYNDMIGGIVAGKQTACFKVIPKINETVPPKDVAQFFKAKINMKGIAPGAIVTPTTPRVDLGDERTALFLVPPTALIPK